MSFVNSILRNLVDLGLMPFRSLPPLVGVAVVSLPFAILALLVYKRFSNQQAIERVKNQMAASFFEIRLFNDDLRSILAAQRSLLRNNLRYMGLNLKPLAVMLVPMFLLFAQLQFHYGYQGLEIGKPAVLSLRLSAEAATAGRPEVALAAPAGIRIDSPAIWAPARQELAWRLVGESSGSYELAIDLDGRRTTKNVVVSDEVVRRSPNRLRPGLVNQLLYPAEDPIPRGVPVEEMTIAYPDAEVWFFGWRTHWSIVLLILSIVFAFALRKRFGVTF
ncbi:MAG TPA: hypothetical protein VMV46_10115 [Thermoanaerobaculia bacterium]|nr:hypothetical protein [Thermoanaerobaculia bacterium]